jgi:hypothetical protein
MLRNPTLGLNIHHHQESVVDLAVQKRMVFFTHRSPDTTAKQVISHAMQQMMIIAQSSR